MPRWLQNLFAMPVSAMIPAEDMQRIADVNTECETLHNGQICFAIERSLGLGNVMRGMTARDRAHQVFSHLRVWDTSRNSGVLLYMLTAEHRIEIVADRGYHEVVSGEQWRGICQLLEERLHQNEGADAVIAAIRQLSELAELEFPRVPSDVIDNELPNAPFVL